MNIGGEEKLEEIVQKTTTLDSILSRVGGVAQGYRKTIVQKIRKC